MEVNKQDNSPKVDKDMPKESASSPAISNIDSSSSDMASNDMLNGSLPYSSERGTLETKTQVTKQTGTEIDQEVLVPELQEAAFKMQQLIHSRVRTRESIILRSLPLIGATWFLSSLHPGFGNIPLVITISACCISLLLSELAFNKKIKSLDLHGFRSSDKLDEIARSLERAVAQVPEGGAEAMRLDAAIKSLSNLQAGVAGPLGITKHRNQFAAEVEFLTYLKDVHELTTIQEAMQVIKNRRLHSDTVHAWIKRGAHNFPPIGKAMLAGYPELFN